MHHPILRTQPREQRVMSANETYISRAGRRESFNEDMDNLTRQSSILPGQGKPAEEPLSSMINTVDSTMKSPDHTIGGESQRPTLRMEPQTYRTSKEQV